MELMSEATLSPKERILHLDDTVWSQSGSFITIIFLCTVVDQLPFVFRSMYAPRVSYQC